MDPGESHISNPPTADSSAVEPSAPLGPGSVVGPFTIEARIGQGGMATVYRARQDKPHRQVALKVIRSDHAADPGYRERFLDETDTLAALEHPSIVPIYAAGEANGVLYIAMRLADRSDLQSWIASRGRLTLAQTVRVLGPIADAIDHAHAMGVVHRDLKPSNIVLDRAERPYLTDFGVGRRLESAGGATPGIEMGTFDFMAPEQFTGRADPGLAAAVDIYALGCVAYTCLTGSPPFVRPTREQLPAAHTSEAPPPVRSLLPEYPEQLDRVLARALAKDPGARFATAREFVTALDAVGNAAPAQVAAQAPATPAPQPIWVPPAAAPVPARAASVPPPAAAPVPPPSASAPAPRATRRRGPRLRTIAIRASALAVVATIAVAAGAAFRPGAPAPDRGGAAVATAPPRTQVPATPVPTPAFPNASEARLVALQPSGVDAAACERVADKNKDALAMIICPAPAGQQKHLFFALYPDASTMADDYLTLMQRLGLADETSSACHDLTRSNHPWRYADAGFFASDEGSLACYPRTEDGFDGIEYVWTHADLNVMGFWLAPDYQTGLDIVEGWLVAARP